MSLSIAAALCRLLFSTYKKNDVLSLMTILDTPIDVLERRGYDGKAVTKIREVLLITYPVDRILKEYEAKLYKGEQQGGFAIFRAERDVDCNRKAK